jgi:hypothetical protein
MHDRGATTASPTSRRPTRYPYRWTVLTDTMCVCRCMHENRCCEHVAWVVELGTVRELASAQSTGSFSVFRRIAWGACAHGIWKRKSIDEPTELRGKRELRAPSHPALHRFGVRTVQRHVERRRARQSCIEWQRPQRGNRRTARRSRREGDATTTTRRYTVCSDGRRVCVGHSQRG